MKRLFIVAFSLFCLSAPAIADDKLKLSMEDAKQLHAFLLTGELLDFGQRANSASAYLMAAELLLDYPKGQVSKERIFKLCAEAKRFADGDDFLESWILRIETRAQKTSRDVLNNFREREVWLRAGESLPLEGEFDAAWLIGDGAELQLLDATGTVLKSGEVVSTEFLDLSSELTWSLHNPTSQPVLCRVLLRKKPT